MMIAAGWRQVHTDASDKKFVKFDQGIYKIPQDAEIESSDDKDWVWCEAHWDNEKDTGYALIGHKRVALSTVENDQYGNDD